MAVALMASTMIHRGATTTSRTSSVVGAAGFRSYKKHPAAPPCIARPLAVSSFTSSLGKPLRSGAIRTKCPTRHSRGLLPLAVANGNTATAFEGTVVVIDNYDSFTYNICQYLGDLGCKYVVFKNDEITVEEIRRMNPAGVLVSPGPGTPEDSGIALQAVTELGPDFPLFGVCMGHQCIGQVYGGNIVRAQSGVMHGKTSPCEHTNVGVLKGITSPFTIARYHSLVIDRETFPEGQLEITAWSDDGMVMGVQHKRYPHIQGVQFHPESVITDYGMDIMRNFLEIVAKGVIDNET